MSQPAASAARSEVETGMILMACAMLMVPGIDALAKLLSATLAPGQVAWGRFFFQTLFLLPILLLGRGAAKPRLDLHAARGALIAGATLMFFWALSHLPLANAISIFFVEPLILTLMSAAFLGEPIGWRRVSAIVVGFAGALIVIQPTWALFGWPALLPLGAACCFAGYLTLTRRLSQSEGAAALQVWAGIFGLLVLSAALAVGAATATPVLDPAWPTLREWALLAGLGMIATAAHLLVVMAFRAAPAGILAPFQYLEIISATLLGLVVFGDFPDALTWAGVAIIIGSGLYVFHRERRLARQAMVPLDQP